MSISFGFGDSQATPIKPTTPFRMLIMGDFSGRKEADLKLHRVDRDNFDSLPGKLSTVLNASLAPGQPPISIQIDHIDDFEPDALFERVGMFEELRQLRRQLQNNATFAAAAEKVRAWGASATAKSDSVQTPPADSSTEAGDLLSSVIDATEQAATDWNDMIESIVGPYIKPGPPPDQKTLIATVDEVISDQMRRLLHCPHFQEMEANWRALSRLIRNVETDRSMQIYLLDASKSSVEQNIGPLAKLLDHQGTAVAGGDPWALLIGAYSFGSSDEDANLVGQLGKIAERVQAPLIADAHGSLVGFDPESTTDLEDATAPEIEPWDLLRSDPAAEWICLTFPRWMARLPYGKYTVPTERFQFEEMAAPVHREFLWANGAFLVAEDFGLQFQQRGWKLDPALPVELSEMPVHVYRDEDGDSCVTPCTEVGLTESSAAKVRELGLVPLIYVRGQDVLRIGGLRSLAGPHVPLRGKWN